MKQDQVIAIISKCEEYIVYYATRPIIGLSYAVYEPKQSYTPIHQTTIYVPQAYQNEITRYVLNHMQKLFALDSRVVLVHYLKKIGTKHRIFYISNDAFYAHAVSKSLDIL